MNRSSSLIGLGALAVVLTACVTHEQPSSLPSIVERPTFTSTVLSVTDGDTLTVLVNGTKEKVRLHGIDCPETDQPFGNQATQLAKQLVLEKAVTVTDFGHDKYRRMLGEVVLPDGRVLNRELVREGFCWWYRKYAAGDTTLERFETEAREAKRGLWAEPNPMPPWEWRKAMK